MTQKEFINIIAPLAQEDMKKSGILASVTIAQACLESGYGTSELAIKANNLFGMKCNLSGNNWKSCWDSSFKYAKKTQEQKPNGEIYYIIAEFRKYPNIIRSIEDHSLYLTQAKIGNKLRYYGLAGETNYRKTITIIKDGGYATDKEYVNKVCKIIENFNLVQYDNKENNKMKICLDAGHYNKYNKSPVNNQYYESDMVWKLHLLQKKYLEEYGVDVILTRASQVPDRGLYERGAASLGCNLFISNHSNAAEKESVDYPVSYCVVNESADEIGLALAQCVGQTMGTIQKARIEHRKGKNGDYYGVLRGAAAVGTPGIILEHSFHTNTKATNWLLDEKNLDKLAKAEVDIIANYYGIKKEQKCGWVHEDGGERFYLGDTGQFVANDWYCYENNWYWFDGSGHMITNTWYQYNNEWYYLGEDGAMVKGLLKDNGKWYYLDQEGRMTTEPIILTPDENGALKYPGLAK